MINFEHSQNIHSDDGPRAALPLILASTQATSLLDVGCGVGTWARAALDLGLTDVFGVDGVAISPEELRIPSSLFKRQDLTLPWSLDRKFDLVLCLEVAEHLSEKDAKVLIESLVLHGDTIVFSAACPGQVGQNHINCQWPAYWQDLFNQCGFICSDAIRMSIWNDTRIECWYRQNLFIARRAATGEAGREPRLLPLVHPEIVSGMIDNSFPAHAALIKAGKMRLRWYLSLPFSVLSGRRKRKTLNP